METALQRIIRKTGRRPVECRCRLCRQQCRIPCLGTPEDILRLLKAGYRERLAPTRWAVGLLLGKIPYIVPMVQAKQEAGGCLKILNNTLNVLQFITDRRIGNKFAGKTYS